MTPEARLNIRYRESDRALLEALADSLGLDVSSTIRFLIREKCRERGIVPAPRVPKKKRRANPT
jgi:hypothetical protein